MEGLILLAISLLVGSFLNGNKNKKKPPTTGPKPFTATGRTEPQNDPLRKLKEMSKEMYKEIQKELQQEPVEPPSRTAPEVVTPEVTPSPVLVVVPEPPTPSSRPSSAPTMVRRPKEQHRGRLSAHGGKIESGTQYDQHDLLPKNEHDLLKGIVFSEILGPPKSKR